MQRILHCLILAVALGTASLVSAQHLRRLVSFGFQPVLVNDSIARVHALETSRGMLVSQVISGTSFAGMGVAVGDILLQLNGENMDAWPALMGIRADLAEGDKLTALVWRKGKEKRLRGTAVGRPREPATAQYEVIYGEAPFAGGHLRTLLNRPKSPGPHPTIYFLPGYPCSSLDGLNALHPYRKLIDSLARLDYLIFRVEKPGVGDGPHPCECETTGFDKELEVFAAGYDALVETEGVDPEQIFVFGHSMGGIQAPILASQGKIKPLGIAVYGIIFQSWYEYVLALLRFQQPRVGDDYLELEEKMKDYTQLMYAHYVELKPLEEIVQNARWKALLEKDFALDAAGNILYRRAFYWQEICRHNVTAAWANTESHVLSMFGEADFEVFNEFSMSEITRIVNAYHPGHAQFRSFPGTDHNFIQVGTAARGAELKGTPAYREYLATQFDYRVVTALHNWIQEVLEKRG